MRTTRLAIYTLSFCLLLGLQALSPSAVAQECPTATQPLSHTFDTGARWQLCWQIDAQLGLVLSHLGWNAPNEIHRQALQEVHLAGLLIHYDDANSPVDIITEYGLGGDNSQALSASNCAGEVLSDSNNQPLLCKQQLYRNSLTRYAGTDTLQRLALHLSSHAQVGAQQWSNSVELTADGMIILSTSLSGRINRFSNSPESGTLISKDQNSSQNTGLPRYASSATLLSVWRLDFNIDNTPLNDRVDEVQFNSDQSEAVRRSISIQRLERETRRQVDPQTFRGWRISDLDLSAATDGSGLTRMGYYLDPQSAGYRYRSNRLNWARYQFFVSQNNLCERTAINNQRRYPDCADSLDQFIDNTASNSATTGLNDTVADPVVWYAQASRFEPHSGDWPTISSRHNSFRLIPFDWSASAPFTDDLITSQ